MTHDELKKIFLINKISCPHVCQFQIQKLRSCQSSGMSISVVSDSQKVWDVQIRLYYWDKSFIEIFYCISREIEILIPSTLECPPLLYLILTSKRSRVGEISLGWLVLLVWWWSDDYEENEFLKVLDRNPPLVSTPHRLDPFLKTR